MQLTVLGTPAEEGGGGKIDLINAGAFKDVDIAMMAHPSQLTLPQPVYVSLTEYVAASTLPPPTDDLTSSCLSLYI